MRGHVSDAAMCNVCSQCPCMCTCQVCSGAPCRCPHEVKRMLGDSLAKYTTPDGSESHWIRVIQNERSEWLLGCDLCRRFLGVGAVKPAVSKNKIANFKFVIDKHCSLDTLRGEV